MLRMLLQSRRYACYIFFRRFLMRLKYPGRGDFLANFSKLPQKTFLEFKPPYEIFNPLIKKTIVPL